MTLTERCIASLAPHAMPMDLNVPPPAVGESRAERRNANYQES